MEELKKILNSKKRNLKIQKLIKKKIKKNKIWNINY
jgi:hypothetical protein